jgi:acetyltransferase
MKALSPKLTHKSEVGGVILNVWSSSEVKTLFDELAQRIKNRSPDEGFEGVAVQPMIRKRGYELLIGSNKDPQFGSVILFGKGGVDTEVCRDTNTGFPPLNQVLAKRLMERTGIYKHWQSTEYAFNVKLLEEILIKFSQLVVDYPEIKAIDINPLIFDGDSAVAVDARIAIDKDRILQNVQPHEHLVVAPYPTRYVTRWELKDGTSTVLRPIKPEDEAVLDEFFKSLSEETMRFRFFQIIRDVPHETLTRYCNLDYDREVAIVAEIQKEKRKIIGAGRIILKPGEKCGEFAVVVGDQWQGLGLGSKLIDCIIDISKDMGLKTIMGYVVSNNSKMINMCTKKGFKFEPFDEELMEATLDLS